jgi:hypothetical protein
MKTAQKVLLVSMLATASMAMSLPAAAERGKHDNPRAEHHSNRHAEARGDGRDRRDRGHRDYNGGRHDGGHYQGHNEGHGKSHYAGGHGHHDRHWAPPRHGHYRQHYYPRPVYGYAPPRFLYVAHGVYGYHDHCSHGYDSGYASGYGSGLSLWLDGVGFSYYERGW